MGGEVIIIAQDPDAVPAPHPDDLANKSAQAPKSKVSVTQIGFKYSDDATPRQIAEAVYRALETAKNLA